MSDPPDNTAKTSAPIGRAGIAAALCLALFALILMLLDFTGVHPGLPGPTGADQIRQLALQSEKWQQVHAAFAVAGAFALSGVLWLWKVILPGGLRPAVHVAAGVGLLGALVFFATVFAEVVMIPDLAKGCTASPACLTAENVQFTETFANVGWRVLPGLDYGARLLMAGLAALALLGWGTDRLRIREALPLFAGTGYELVGGTGLHRWGTFRLESGLTGLCSVLVLLAAAAMLFRALSGPKPMLPQPTPASPAESSSPDTD